MCPDLPVKGGNRLPARGFVTHAVEEGGGQERVVGDHAEVLAARGGPGGSDAETLAVLDIDVLDTVATGAKINGTLVLAVPAAVDVVPARPFRHQSPVDHEK